MTARRPDTNVTKNEKQLVRVAASVDMKHRAEERSDRRLTVQSERLNKKEKKKKMRRREGGRRGGRRSAKGPVALAAAADVSQTGVFFFLLHPTSSLCTLLFSFYALREKLITCGLESDNVSRGGWILLVFFCFLF